MKRSALCTLILVTAACSGDRSSTATSRLEPPPAPAAVLAPLVGDYAAVTDTLSILEDSGSLHLKRWHAEEHVLSATTDSTFVLASAGSPGGGAVSPAATLAFRRDSAGGVTAFAMSDSVFDRLRFAPEDGSQFRITPLKSQEELRREAMGATPPKEEGDFLPPDLVELVTLDSAIKLDIRYATTNNFMGEPFYSQARAFLQRPAAEAVVRANQWLMQRGYGLLVHDGYRPWYVTKMFWDATPESLKVFVADPANGSRHNRGCAVDLTLYDLATGKPVVMPGGYDEMSPRSYEDYPGGTARQRWFRALLRQAMEAQGFAVYEAEWWHFDYKDWRRYRIGNEPFEEIGAH
ncbi:MAG: M15 family metallopeptidase [Gemmatimonadetes bacterium]|nr:M15 family metallopeptidase [Gemmatimonadota bacterium]